MILFIVTNLNIVLRHDSKPVYTPYNSESVIFLVYYIGHNSNRELELCLVLLL